MGGTVLEVRLARKSLVLVDVPPKPGLHLGRMSTRNRGDDYFEREIQRTSISRPSASSPTGWIRATPAIAARRAFGNVAAAERALLRKRSRVDLGRATAQDIRYALRTLWRSRTFVATTVATLAVALGLVTVLFAVFNAYVLRPFAIPDPYSLYRSPGARPTTTERGSRGGNTKTCARGTTSSTGRGSAPRSLRCSPCRPLEPLRLRLGQLLRHAGLAPHAARPHPRGFRRRGAGRLRSRC